MNIQTQVSQNLFWCVNFMNHRTGELPNFTAINHGHRNILTEFSFEPSKNLIFCFEATKMSSTLLAVFELPIKPSKHWPLELLYSHRWPSFPKFSSTCIIPSNSRFSTVKLYAEGFQRKQTEAASILRSSICVRM